MIGRHHLRRNPMPFCEVEPQVRSLYEHQKRRELELERKNSKDLVKEELNASAFRELEGSMAMETQINAQKWSRIQAARLNESLKKELPTSPKDSISYSTVTSFKPEVFRTPTIQEKIKSSQPEYVHEATPVTQHIQKTLLHKTDSVIKTTENFVSGPHFDFQTSTPTTQAKLSDLSFRPSIIPGQSQPLTQPPTTAPSLFAPKPLDTTPIKSTLPAFQTPPSSQSASSPPQATPPFQTPPSGLSIFAPVSQSTPSKPPATVTPIKFEPQILEEYHQWIQKLTKDHKIQRQALAKYRKESSNAQFCATLKRVINEHIDVTTSKDFKDVERLSKIYNFITDILSFKPVRGSADGTEIKLNDGDETALEYTMAWICERYMKLVASDADLTETVATIFAMVVKQIPKIRDRLIGLVLSSSTLLRMDPLEIAAKCDELATQPVEESANWLPEEANKVRLLIKVSFYSKEVVSDNIQGMTLLATLLKTAVNSPPIPIATCFVINLTLQTTIKQLKKVENFDEMMNKIRYLSEFNWTQHLNTLKSTLKHSQAPNVLESRHNATLQQLKSTISTLQTS